MGKLGVWLVAAFVLIALLEFAPRLGGVLLLALVAYLAIQVEGK